MLAVAVEVLAEALLDLASSPGGISSLMHFCADDDAQFGVEVERLQAVHAAVEMALDGLPACRR